MEPYHLSMSVLAQGEWAHPQSIVNPRQQLSEKDVVAEKKAISFNICGPTEPTDS
jgi:hypothetical protein